ncbi:MAG: DNA repair protein RecO [Deltaproteobacteria bacterium]|nr:DNA repair protein RecO [Deltaproteobacteria bacterium]
MSSVLNVEAIVLKTWPYGENDLIVSLMTLQKGKIRGLAKGARASRKRFCGTLDLCSHAQFLVRERKNNNLVFIEQASLISGYIHLRKDYFTLMMAMGLLEMADFFSHENHIEHGSFQILQKALKNLEKAGDKIEIFWATALEYLKWMGISPSFEGCSRCEKKLEGEKIFFSLREARLLCTRCVVFGDQTLGLSQELCEWLRNVSLQGGEVEKMNSSQIKMVSSLVESHLSFHFHCKPDWSRFLER